MTDEKIATIIVVGTEDAFDLKVNFCSDKDHMVNTVVKLMIGAFNNLLAQQDPRALPTKGFLN